MTRKSPASAVPSCSVCTAAPAPSGAGSSSAAPLAEGLGKVAGLAALVGDLWPEHQEAALTWCKDNEASSVQCICAADKDDAFVASMSLKPGGVTEVVLRKRLDKIRQALARDSDPRVGCSVS